MNSGKNILIVSPFFFPEPISTGKFNTDMALALNANGNNVKVFCFHPFYPKWETEKSNESLPNIEIIRGGKNLKYTNKTILRRFILEVGFAFFVFRKIFKHQKNVDIIIPVFPPSLALTLILPFLKNSIEKVGMIHDLQEVYSKNKKGIFYKWIGKIIHQIEKRGFQSCDKLIFLSEEMKNEAKKSYQLTSTNLKVQYPFATLNVGNKGLTNDLGEIFQKGIKHIVYSGALGEKQNPKELYRVFNYCSGKLPEIRFHFFSQGTLFEELKEVNNNSKILFHNLVAQENLEELYHKSFIQLIPQAIGTSKGSLPSKLPNLLASKCNVLCITDQGSEIDLLFKKHKLKKVITSWDKEVVLNGIEEFLLEKKENNSKQVEISTTLFNINSMLNSILEN